MRWKPEVLQTIVVKAIFSAETVTPGFYRQDVDENVRLTAQQAENVVAYRETLNNSRLR